MRPVMAIASINPATGETLASFAVLSDDEIENKLQTSVSAYALNRARPFAERASRLRKAGDLLEARAQKYARLMTLEMGKPITAAVSEVRKCALVCRYYADNGERFLA